MYLSVDELKAALSEQTLIELSNDDYQATTVNDGVVRVAIDFGQQLIDGYLRSRYTLPLASPHTLLKQLNIDISRHWLYQRRPEGRELPEAVTSAYKNAVKTLEAVQGGKLHLGVSGLTDDDLANGNAEFKVSAPSGVDTSGY